MNQLVVITSPNTWAELRVLYESGEYPNIKSLYDRNWRKFPDMPSMRELQERCFEECWDKDRLTEVRVELKRRNLAELYSELGMDDMEQARYRIKCVKAVDDMRRIINRMYRTLGSLDPESPKFTETLGKIKVLSETMFKGMNTSLAALQDISKQTGGYAPAPAKEQKKTGKGANELDGMTEEEIIQDLKRMQAAGIDLTEIEELKTPPDEQKGPDES